MNWENCEFASDSDETKPSESESTFHSSTIHDENEQKKLIQLHKLKDLSKNECRKAYITAATTFGELLLNGNQEEIVRTFLTDDCETFLFNFGEICPLKYGSNSQEFSSVYKDAQLMKRQIKESFVDLESTTAFQICYCEILNKSDKSIMSQFSFEVFSFRGDRISKYRSCFGHSSCFDEFHHPFEPSRKDKMLAKVKELNYAWASEPDFERIASLLHESTEYKVWSWEDQKRFSFYKNDFVTDFKSLEENYMIKCVVPYEVYSEGQYIIGTYAYHLEGRHELLGQRFMWLSTCIYTFDKDLNIAKVTQQGELHPEDEVKIPFEVYSRVKIKQAIIDAYLDKQALKQDGKYTIVDTNEFLFSFEASRFGPANYSEVGFIKGFNDYHKVLKVHDEKNHDFEWGKAVDVFIDCHDPSYDVAIVMECPKGAITRENYKYSGVMMNFFAIKKLSIENGKVAKLVAFISEIPEMIPSPYDDLTFAADNIRPKENLIA